jgi:hypothetical protein
MDFIKFHGTKKNKEIDFFEVKHEIITPCPISILSESPI